MTPRGRATAPHLGPGEAGAAERTLDLDSAGSTPILREYRAVKAGHPDALVLVRLGDFFELFGTDAEAAAPVLGVTLTGRSFGGAGRLPMCGVPHQAAGQHVRRLLDAGLRVVLWEQVGEAVPGQLVRREVTRVMSPGTVVEDEYLEPGRPSRCLALLPGARGVGIAALEASTGDLQLGELEAGLDSAALADECDALEAAELLVPDGCQLPASLAAGVPRTSLAPSLFDPGRAEERLRERAGTAAATGLERGELALARAAAGALLAYCERSRITLSPGFLRVRPRPSSELMRLDSHTRRNLEILAPLRPGGSSLLQLLGSARTPMGTRLLRARLQQPLTSVTGIVRRLDSVAALAADPEAAERLDTSLAQVRDLERLVGRCVQGSASARDLAGVRDAVEALPGCAAAVAPLEADELAAAAAACSPPAALAGELRRLLVDEPPASSQAGGAIRPGADGELDSLRAAGGDARAFISGLEERERARTGIRSLRVGYNRVFGYYLEVPHSQRDAVPADYIRKQTLVGAERFVTPDLKEHEAIVLHSRERAVGRELELLAQLRDGVAAHATALLEAASAVAVLDVARALAAAAAEHRWVRPEVDSGERVDIEAGRHPLVEQALGPSRFVPNDCALDASGRRILLITGPNMAGKSTYLRQVALTVLLAQAGSYVPAARARIGVCDRIFTRIGAQDDLAGGLSTFMVEMAETAAILQQASRRSLVILDEIGRGTSTYDGLSIARAVVEHLHDAPHLGCRTLFATHYHELTSLAGPLPGVRNVRVEVLEEGERITFLHRIVDGGADRSYGIHVAKLAGVPSGVIARARQLLSELEAARPLGSAPPVPGQLTLALPAAPRHPVVDRLSQLDIDGLTPLQALTTLAELREDAGR